MLKDKIINVRNEAVLGVTLSAVSVLEKAGKMADAVRTPKGQHFAKKSR